MFPTAGWDGKGGLLWWGKTRLWRSQARTLWLPEGKTCPACRSVTLYTINDSIIEPLDFSFDLRLETTWLLINPERRLCISTGCPWTGQVNNLVCFFFRDPLIYYRHTHTDVISPYACILIFGFLLALCLCCSSSSVFGHSCVWSLWPEQAGGLHWLEAFLWRVAAEGEIPQQKLSKDLQWQDYR